MLATRVRRFVFCSKGFTRTITLHFQFGIKLRDVLDFVLGLEVVLAI